jgi:DNA polymerase-3 subunit gamma/tau
MTFYRKYRPKLLSDIIGQEFVRQTLQSAIKNQQVSHAYLFFGSRGTGKTSTARILAKALNCKNPKQSGDPCNQCDFCISADSGNFVDIIEIDGASNRKIEHARALIEKIHFAPTLGKKKIYIIDEVHMFTKEAFNALLKTIEEPPDHAHFLLATTELEKVPETIRSRCQVFIFHRFTPEQIAKRLQDIAQKEDIHIADKEALFLIAKKSIGGLRDAIGLFEQVSIDKSLSIKHLQDELGITSFSQVSDFFTLLHHNETEKALHFINEISSEGLSLDDFLEQFLELLREKMILFSTSEKNPSELSFVLKGIEHFDAARKSLFDTPIPTLPIEIAIIKTIEMNKSNAENSFLRKQIQEHSKEKVKKEDERKKDLSPVKRIKSLENSWKELLETIDDAVLKGALFQAKYFLKKKKLSIVFPAQSWKRQIEGTDRFSKLSHACKKIFDQEISISLQVSHSLPPSIEKIKKNDHHKEAVVEDPSIISEIFKNSER